MPPSIGQLTSPDVARARPGRSRCAGTSSRHSSGTCARIARTARRLPYGNAVRRDHDEPVGVPEAIRALAVVHAALVSPDRGGQAVEVAEILEAAT